MRRHFFIATLLCLLSISTNTFALNNILLPDIGDNAGSISPLEEYRTGEAVIRNIRRAGGIIDDPLSQNYLNDIAYRIVAATGSQQPFHFFLIADNNINAFALPGGFIGINAGLILASKSESELAGVIAHEMAHITQRHHARHYEKGSSSIPVIAALIAAIVLGGDDISQAALASAAAGTIQSQINFTRENEKEADRIGIELLINSDFNPHGMTSFFETLDKKSRLYGESIPEFLRSHPVTPSRISDSKNRASKYPNVLSINSTNYNLLRERLNILATENKAELVKKYANRLAKGLYQNKQATQYGYALALQLNKKYAPALKQVQTLLRRNPENISYNLLKAQLETDLKNDSIAIETYQKLLLIYPTNRAINIFYAKALIKANKLSQAHAVLQQQISFSNKTPDAYRLLAEVQAKMKQTSNSHQSLAEYYYLLGQTHDAIKQLEIALKTPKKNFYLTSRLESRLKEFKEEILLLQTK